MSKEDRNKIAEELVKRMVKDDAIRFIYGHDNKKLVDALND